MTQTVELWTATRLLMRGWEIAGKELLGMAMIDDIYCPLHGSVPAPRVLQNQLDRNLELYIIAKENQLLKTIQFALMKKHVYCWNSISLAVIVMLHVLERDSWRLMYWRKHGEEVSHPESKPTVSAKYA